MSENSPPEVAKVRIEALYKTAKQLSIATGGDPAEAMFELVAAAIMICHEARSTRDPSLMIADVAPAAAATVDEWFADFLKRVRCKHG